MPDGLYTRDILAWAGEQAALLQRFSKGERLNQAIDWSHVVQEVQGVGLSELRSCQSHLVLAMAHLIKRAQWPDHPSFNHWGSEAAAFLQDAQRRFTPSMRPRINLDACFAGALQLAARHGPLGPGFGPAQCPFTWDELLDEDLRIAALTGKLGQAA